jgi:hypothetical protein
MKEDQRKKMTKEFSFTNFLLVTGLSFLVFTGAMRMLDGVTINILLKIGIVCLGAGVLLSLVKFGLDKLDKKKSSGIESEDNSY